MADRYYQGREVAPYTPPSKVSTALWAEHGISGGPPCSMNRYSSADATMYGSESIDCEPCGVILIGSLFNIHTLYKGMKSYLI